MKKSFFALSLLLFFFPVVMYSQTNFNAWYWAEDEKKDTVVYHVVKDTKKSDRYNFYKQGFEGACFTITMKDSVNFKIKPVYESKSGDVYYTFTGAGYFYENGVYIDLKVCNTFYHGSRQLNKYFTEKLYLVRSSVPVFARVKIKGYRLIKPSF